MSRGSKMADLDNLIQFRGLNAYNDAHPDKLHKEYMKNGGDRCICSFWQDGEGCVLGMGQRPCD